jgi:hypothetical protein
MVRFNKVRLPATNGLCYKRSWLEKIIDFSAQTGPGSIPGKLVIDLDPAIFPRFEAIRRPETAPPGWVAGLYGFVSSMRSGW